MVLLPLWLVACDPGKLRLDDADTDTDTDSDTDTDTDSDADADTYQATDAAWAWAPESNYAAGEYLDAGDINGDGYADVALTTFYANRNTGGAYVVYGPVDGAHVLDDVGDRIQSESGIDGMGRSIAVADANGDGVDDLAIGAADSTCREWIFFGPLQGDVTPGDAAVVRVGLAGTEAGHGSDLADVDGDGQADLLIGAYEDDRGGRDAGAVFIEPGPIEAGEFTVDERAVTTLIGESRSSYAGRYVTAGGDVDGDGIGDIVAAAPYASGGAPNGGAAYLVFGGVTGEVDLADADAKFLGEGSNDYAGEGVGMGDVDGDGLADVLLGSASSEVATYAGAAYVIRGPGTSVSGLDDADVILRGDGREQLFGLSLAAGDLDGDGVLDLIVGARGDNAGERGGAAYAWFGPVRNGGGTEDADASFMAAHRNDAFGWAVVAPDLDADGVGELVVGAPGEDSGGTYAGAIFVFEL